MKKMHLIFYSFLLVLGVVICRAAWQMGYGEMARPGSGFLPFWCGLIIALLSGWIVLGRLREKAAQGVEKIFQGIDPVKPLSIFAAMILYCLLLEKAGFLLANFLFLALILRLVWRRNLGFVLGTSLVIDLAFYTVFQKMMDVQLPPGIFREILY